MKDYKLPARKPDLLDELNALRQRRGAAYRAGDIEILELVHLEMKAFWLRNGWDEGDAHEEYLQHIIECEVPYVPPVGHPSIVHSIYDFSKNLKIGNLSLADLSNYYFNRAN